MRGAHFLPESYWHWWLISELFSPSCISVIQCTKGDPTGNCLVFLKFRTYERKWFYDWGWSQQILALRPFIEINSSDNKPWGQGGWDESQPWLQKQRPKSFNCHFSAGECGGRCLVRPDGNIPQDSLWSRHQRPHRSPAARRKIIAKKEKQGWGSVKRWNVPSL